MQLLIWSHLHSLFIFLICIIQVFHMEQSTWSHTYIYRHSHTYTDLYTHSPILDLLMRTHLFHELPPQSHEIDVLFVHSIFSRLPQVLSSYYNPKNFTHINLTRTINNFNKKYRCQKSRTRQPSVVTI